MRDVLGMTLKDLGRLAADHKASILVEVSESGDVAFSFSCPLPEDFE